VFTFREPLEHGAPGVIAEGAEDEIELRLMFSHVVEHIGRPIIINRFVECLRTRASVIRTRPTRPSRGAGVSFSTNAASREAGAT
jgi:hypothetical protein